ncbi:hypothetical protein EGX86_04420 [Citrobacter koseri]|nr:hypothetical protein EGX86_04420 [Citrobacter koseri]
MAGTVNAGIMRIFYAVLALSNSAYNDYTRHTSSCRCVGCTQKPQSHSYLCSWGFLPLPPSCNSNYLGYILFAAFYPRLIRVRANGTKTITLFCDWRYNRSQSQFSNQKSIANEKHQSDADFCLAGTTKTLRRHEGRYYRGSFRER